MPLEVNDAWFKTRDALHTGLRAVGWVKRLVARPIPNYLHYAIVPTEYGASSGDLPFGGELVVDYPALSVSYAKPGGGAFDIALSGASEQTILRNLLEMLASQHDQISAANLPESISDGRLIADEASAVAYLKIQTKMNRVLNQARNKLAGTKTPVVLWPHGFDLSFLYFLKGQSEDHDPHMNFGFSPGQLKDQPYLYHYAWPVREELFGLEPPSGGQWQSQWSVPGIKFELEHIRSMPLDETVDLLINLSDTAKPYIKERG
ncbi:MAG TPA: DUF5996 family protein [Candidatus Saccharimonadales bacterium]